MRSGRAPKYTAPTSLMSASMRASALSTTKLPPIAPTVPTSVQGTPYRSASPIFLHTEPCVPPDNLQQLPAQLTERQLSVRSFDPAENMIDAIVIDGHDLHATIERFFTDPESRNIHVHNATRGCWAVTIERT